MIRKIRRRAGIEGIGLLRCRHISLLLICLLTLIQADTPCIAESSEHFAFRFWRTQDGLPESYVRSLAQTRDGLLWVGTPGGLTQFDGESFETFDRSNTPAFSKSSVHCMLVSRDGSLWIGTDGGGLIRRHNGLFKQYSFPGRLNNAFVWTIFEDTEGRLWAGTDSGLYRWTGDPTDQFISKVALSGLGVQAISQGHDGRLWFGGAGLYVIDHGQIRQARVEREIDPVRVKSILQTRDGSIWVGAVSGLYRRRANESTFTRVTGISGGVRLLMEAADSTLWIGTIGDGLFQFRNGRLARLTVSSSVPTNSVLAIFQDKDKNVWMGTQEGLLQMLPSSVNIVHLPEKSDPASASIYLDPDGTLWAPAQRLFRIHNDIVTTVSIPELKGIDVRNVIKDRANTLWIGTNGSGLFHMTPRGVVRYTIANGLVSNFVRVIMQARDGSLWIGTAVGVSHLTGSGFHNFGMSDGLSYSEIQAIVQTNDGDIWIATTRGLSHIHNNVFQDDDIVRRLKSLAVSTLNVDRSGHLWVGIRDDGLYGYDHGILTHFTTTDGLTSNSIYSILSDKTGHLWLCGPDGASRVNISDLNAHARHPAKEIFPRHYYISDGKEAVQLYGVIKPGGAVGPGGDVWFPSDHGPVHIFPGDHLTPRPGLRITHVLADGKEVWGGDAIRLAPDNSALQIAYSSILLMPQDGIRYSYKLDGFDKDWTNVFGRRTAYFTNIPAGNYIFRVRSYDSDHLNGYAEASVIVVKRRHFYWTPWFIGCIIATLCMLLWLAYRQKERHANARFRAILEERSRLAREIHETLLQGCASVSSLLEACSSAEANLELRRELVNHARSQIGSTMDEARRAVWNLRQPDEANADIRKCIEVLAERTSKEFGIPVQCNCDDAVCLIDHSRMHDITMVAREALYNALVHSSANVIEIAAKYSSGQVVISICDDGNGFDPSQVSSEGHYGLTGMQERVSRLGGLFYLQADIGKGTEVRFSIPVNSRCAAGRQ